VPVSWDNGGSILIVHEPWEGPDYAAGINGKRVAIVGNSHWHEPGEPDSANCTQVVVGKVISGEWDIAFFSHIGDYFGIPEPRDFWNRTVFFNYAPRSIGTRDEKYDNIPPEYKEEAIARFGSIVRDKAPTDVFIFSRKIAWALPPREVWSRTYPFPGAATGTLKDLENSPRVHLLRHPQYAPKAQMTATVAEMMAD